MRSRVWAVPVIVCVMCAFLALASMPAAATASPSSGAISKTIAGKQAQAAQATVELAAMRSQLTTALAQFDDVSMKLDAARQDVLTSTDRLSALDGEIADREAALNRRAVALYTSGSFDVIQALLSVDSLEELLSRVDMFAIIQQSDTDLLTGLATARDQSAFLQQQQAQREADLITLRQQMDARRALVDAAVARQQAVMRSLSADVAVLVKARDAAAAAEAAQVGGSAPAGFDPNTLVSDSVYLDSAAMSASSIQSFLDGKGGPLKSYSGPDHNGVTKTAAQMIADAALAWGVNPKIVLVTLQKEQSLITSPGSGQTALDWAMGCGKTDSVTYTQYRGFGNQIWGGAQKLISNRSFWSSGISVDIDGKAVYPTNASTHALYRYTPHFNGATSFWSIYWRYFGNPVQ